LFTIFTLLPGGKHRIQAFAWAVQFEIQVRELVLEGEDVIVTSEELD
jgi:hypothetical protein